MHDHVPSSQTSFLLPLPSYTLTPHAGGDDEVDDGEDLEVMAAAHDRIAGLDQELYGVAPPLFGLSVPVPRT